MSPSHAPRVDHWPQALRSAALLSGTVLPCGPGLRPVGWPETPTTRVVAIAQHITPNSAVCGESAAWIWGACRSPGTPLTMTTRRGRVPVGHTDLSVAMHEYRLEPDELQNLGPYAVTSKLRTAYDLLRTPETFTLKRHIACRLLLMHIPDAAQLLEARAGRSSRSDRGRVSRRLRALY